MEPVICASVILVVADSNFINLCRDPANYVSTLKQRVAEKRGGNAVLHTITGKYGLTNVDPSLPFLDITDRNKTLFGQTLENSALLFDELMLITINEKDPYMNSAQEVATQLSKTSTKYGYPRK